MTLMRVVANGHAHQWKPVMTSKSSTSKCTNRWQNALDQVSSYLMESSCYKILGNLIWFLFQLFFCIQSKQVCQIRSQSRQRRKPVWTGKKYWVYTHVIMLFLFDFVWCVRCFAQLNALFHRVDSSSNAVLSTFLSHQMKEAFGDDWQKLVYKKPPWSLLNLFECFDKLVFLLV